MIPSALRSSGAELPRVANVSPRSGRHRCLETMLCRVLTVRDRRWLARRFFEETGGAPSSEALQSALNVIEAKAHFDAPERQVHIRVGGLDGRLYLDLGDETWRAVEIDATGWRVIDNPPVRFRRASGMKPMPIPVGGGSVETLRSFLNVRPTPISCWWSPGRWPAFAIAVPIR